MIGKSCITLFVVFVIVLFSFGHKPWVTQSTGTGYSLHFDAISCLGIGLGIYAVFFFLREFRDVLRLGKTRKILGLIGGFGLIAHTALAVLAPLGAPAAPAAGPASVAKMGAEQWQIDGSTYELACSYYLPVDGGVQYMIDYVYPDAFARGMPTSDQASRIAWPLLRHAYQQGLYKRLSVAKLGQGRLEPVGIGVCIIRDPGDTANVCRINASLERIRELLAAAAGQSPNARRDGEQEE